MLAPRIPLFFCAVMLAGSLPAQELPAPAPERQPLDFEPQLILTDPGPAPALGASPGAPTGEVMDVAKAEAALAKAQRKAANDARLLKQGILAKVEAERSALRVVLLTKNLAEARMLEAKIALEAVGEGTPEAKATATEALAKAEQAARTETAAYLKAQVDAASLNLWRQQKLQGWGGASKAAVARAQEQLALAKRQHEEQATPPAGEAAK